MSHDDPHDTTGVNEAFLDAWRIDERIADERASDDGLDFTPELLEEGLEDPQVDPEVSALHVERPLAGRRR